MKWSGINYGQKLRSSMTNKKSYKSTKSVKVREALSNDNEWPHQLQFGPIFSEWPEKSHAVHQDHHILWEANVDLDTWTIKPCKSEFPLLLVTQTESSNSPGKKQRGHSIKWCLFYTGLHHMNSIFINMSFKKY